MELRPSRVSLIEPGEGISMLLASSLRSLPQQLSAAPVPVELLAPLTYISLVGCSISVMASLLTLLLHVHTRYSAAPGQGLCTHSRSAPCLLSYLLPESEAGFSRGWRPGGRRTSLCGCCWVPAPSPPVSPSLHVYEPRGWRCLGDVPRPQRALLPPTGGRETP